MKVGFVGVGMMGGPMCRNVLKGGHEVVVFDINPDAIARVSGAKTTVADSPKAVAGQVDIIFTSLPMPADVEQVVLGENGIAAGARSGATVVDLSTNAPAVVKRISEALAAKGIAFLDAPVSGGVDGAEAATLAIMCGGKQDAFDRVKPILGCMGANVFLTGPIGSGSIAKLCNNMVSFCNLAVASEALMLATRAGLNPRMMADVMAASSGGSNSLKRLSRKGLRGDWAQEFALNLAHKDLTLALDLGRQTETPLAYGSYTYTLLQQGRVKGWGKDDVGVVLRLLESALETEVRE
ncbi:MAG TPA: NAD(P)-dependent oxidoreductase [bacterium]|nr:NAD(P)-dependent oxidoreductase [bacterium]